MLHMADRMSFKLSDARPRSLISVKSGQRMVALFKRAHSAESTPLGTGLKPRSISSWRRDGEKLKGMSRALDRGMDMYEVQSLGRAEHEDDKTATAAGGILIVCRWLMCLTRWAYDRNVWYSSG